MSEEIKTETKNTEEVEEYKEPSVMTHAKRLYEAMLEHSYPEGDVHVFVGKTTELFKQLGISTAYYSRIRRILISSGSIQIVRRGARGIASEVRLYHPPEDFTIEDLTAPPDTATLVVDLANRIARLEAWHKSQGGLDTKEALRDHETRLTQLEGKSQQ
jgi:hypothetical protein